jgi:nitrate reductase gamma subunit
VSTRALFLVAPAAAVAWLALALALRLLVPRPPAPAPELGATVRTFRRRGRWIWPVGLLGTLAGHALFLLAPSALQAWNARLPRLIAYEATAFGFGLLAAVGLGVLLRAHLRDEPLRSVRSLADTALLGLLAVSIGSGLALAVTHRWASSWTLATLTPYVHSLAALSPDLRLVDGMPYLVKLHVLSAVAFVFVLPLSRLLDLALLPLERAAAAAARPLRAAGLRLRRVLEDRARRAARAFWWEEDEDHVA